MVNPPHFALVTGGGRGIGRAIALGLAECGARVVLASRTKEELDQVIEWFTGFDKNTLQSLLDEKVTFRTFFEKANIHQNAHLIKGVVCGYRIEEIEDEFKVYKECRQLEKLIEELARGRKMEKILRADPA